MSTRLVRMGNSVAVTLPRDVLQAAGLQRGDDVEVTVAAEGRLVVERTDSPHNRAMALGRQAMRRYHTALAILAK